MEKNNLELILETSWLEDSGTDYDRVVVLHFSTNNAVYTSSVSSSQDQVTNKLQEEIGMVEQIDYVFTSSGPRGPKKQGRATSQLMPDSGRIVIRIKDEEHFAMLKLRYNA